MHVNRTFLAVRSKGLAIALTATLATAGLGLGMSAPLSAAQAQEAADATAEAPASTTPTTGAVSTTAEAPAVPEAAQEGQDAQNAQAEAPAPQPVETTSAVVSLTDLSSTAAQLYDAIDQARAAQGLAPLTRDANLEAAAWQRAAETTVLRAPVRPNGSAFTATSTTMSVESQVLLAGTQDQVGTAAAALALMQADPADAQALASADAASVGVALVQDAAGNLYWAVLLSAAPSSASVATGGDAVDGMHEYTVDIPTANMAASTSESVELTLAPGATKQLYPVAHATGQLDVDGVQYAYNSTTPLGVNSTATWESSAPGVVSVDGTGNLTVVSSGTAMVSAKTASGSTTWSVTVSDPSAQAEDPQADDMQADNAQAGEETRAPADDAAAEQEAPQDPEASDDAEQPAQSEGDAQSKADAQGDVEVIDLAQCTIVGLTELSLDENGDVAEPSFSVTAPDGAATIPADQYTAEFTYDAETQTGTLVLTANPDSQTLTGTLAREVGLSEEAKAALAAQEAEQQAPQGDGTQSGDAAGQASQDGDAAGSSSQDAATDISTAMVTLDGSNYPYTGSAVAPKPTVRVGDATLVEGADYTLSYTDNVEPGLVTITITGTGAYTGTRTTTFNIVQNGKPTLADAGFSIATIDDQQYTGGAVTPDVSVSNGTATLSKGSDYTVTYTNNLNAGTATVTVTASEGSNYIGSLNATFTIAPVQMNALRIEVPNQYYTGMALQPVPRSVSMLSGFALTQGTDYDVVSYRDNVEVGTAYVTLQGKGNFSGTVEAAFKIVQNTDGNAAATNASDAAGVSTTLPATGDTTSAMPLVAAGVAGTALIGGGILLTARRRRQGE